MTDTCRVEGDTSYSDTLTNIYANGMRKMGEQLVSGQLTLDQWHQDMKDAIDGMFVKQGMAGVQHDESQVDTSAITDQVAEQYQYLDGFAADIEQAMASGKSLDFVPSRAAQYAGSSQQSFWTQATGEADLPAQPGDGSSECLGNCGCKWECHDGEWYWVRGKDDSCPTCLKRAAEWAPYNA